MEFSRKEEKAVEATIAAIEQDLVQLTDLQMLDIGGGVADVTLS